MREGCTGNRLPFGKDLSHAVSHPGRSLLVVERSDLPTAAEANAALRAYAAGRRSWTPEELAELARLRRAWLDAERREPVLAA